MDIGRYFGQVIVRNVPETRWDQVTKNRRDINYGQPVVTGVGKVPLNPVHIATMVAYAISRKHRDSNELRRLYGVWAERRLDSGPPPRDFEARRYFSLRSNDSCLTRCPR